MPRIARSELSDGVFHVTNRGVERGTIFRDGIDYAEFERQLLSVSDEYAWGLRAYCLLPNHYHLVVEAKQADLSTGMHKLNGRYAQRFNRRYDRAGHVFQNRFGARVIETDEHYERALAYVVGNAVEAGLCERAEDWPWVGGPSDLD